MRFIPACAGNTRPSTTAPCRSPGSSPRVRGTRAVLRGAGSRNPVHPRVCGEHVCCALLIAGAVAGSSPRVRGTLGPRVAHRRPGRFIPACAGNTARPNPAVAGIDGSSPRVRGTPVLRDMTAENLAFHPRVCGEHHGGNAQHVAGFGSSPRVRGTHGIHTPNPPRQRFIPACAGNTPNRMYPAPLLTVHPRVCGEHWREHGIPDCDAGSSPRVRGTRRFNRQQR